MPSLMDAFNTSHFLICQLSSKLEPKCGSCFINVPLSARVGGRQAGRQAGGGEAGMNHPHR